MLKIQWVFKLNILCSAGWLSTTGGAYQTAYQVAASSDEEKLLSGDYDLWDSGKVASDRNFGVIYNGRKLSSGQRVYWKVRIWDEKDNVSQFSDPAYFEIGLLNPSDWKGRWMGFLGGLIGNGILLRYSFTVKKKARQGFISVV